MVCTTKSEHVSLKYSNILETVLTFHELYLYTRKIHLAEHYMASFADEMASLNKHGTHINIT